MRPDECTNMPDNGFQVIPLRAFTDNYVWTLRNAACAAVVDPGEARPVLDYLAAEKLLLVAILATHHHQDHVGGIAEILETHAVPVYGPRGEPITTLTHPVGGGDRVAVEQLGVAFEVLDIPGHTRAHIAYYGSNMLLCGDTLLDCGSCGPRSSNPRTSIWASASAIRPECSPRYASGRTSSDQSDTNHAVVRYSHLAPP